MLAACGETHVFARLNRGWTNYGFDCMQSRSHGFRLEGTGFDFRKSFDESIETRANVCAGGTVHETIFGGAE
jgi:hypothetical protein